MIHEMEREARRTLHSLSAAYQEGVTADDYEVIVVDSGSRRPFNQGSIEEFGPNFSYHYLHDANRSPSRAMSLGVRLARCDYLALMIDGARILTPGVLRYGLMLPSMFRHPCGMVLGFHIGPDFQPRSIEKGYNRFVEDELLEKIAWPAEPYRLFEISSAHDHTDGWFRLVGESNFTFIHREILERVGGFDERYVSVGGGLVNLDVQTAIYDLPEVDLVMIVGEGTFHQYHGGATSGQSPRVIDILLSEFAVEYRKIRGKDFDGTSERQPHYVGHIPAEAYPFLKQFVGAASPDLVSSQRRIHTLHREVLFRDRMIERLHGEIADRDQVMHELHTQVSHRDHEIETLRTEARAMPPRRLSIAKQSQATDRSSPPDVSSGRTGEEIPAP